MRPVRRTVLLAFAAWHGLASAKNACDVLAALRIAPAAAPFRSKNLEAMEKLLASWHPSRTVLAGLLGGVAAVEAAAALAFAAGNEELAFTLAVLLFTAFMLIDDAFTDYQLDATHRNVLVLLLVGYLVVRYERR